MGYFRPNFPKMVLASDWWRASSEKRRESSENLRKGSEKSSEKRGQGKAEKKQGGVGGGRPEKSREGWVVEGQKKRGRGG